MRRLTTSSRFASITARVTVIAVLSAASGGLLASAVAVAAVDTLIARQLDQRLLAATFTLADELDEEKKYDDAKLRETLDDENAEIASSGIVLSVFESTKPLAGDPHVAVPSSECESHGPLGRRVRVCARPYGSWTLIARQPSDVVFLAWMYLAAALCATGLGAAVGGLLSRPLTAWAVGSLTQLKRAIERSAPDAPRLPAAPSVDSSEVLAVRVALERQMQRSYQLLQQARRFASNAAHELRTPLTTLRAELELMAEEASETSSDVLLRSCRRVEHLSSLVERLLILTVPVEQVHRLFETTSLSDVIEGVLQRLPASERERIVLDEGSDEPLLRGDPGLLATLVDNCIANALKYAPGELVRVTVSMPELQRTIRLTIEDPGPGVPSELREEVFEAFFRASSDHQGHGLGLALVSHIAQVHGGRAWFEDVPKGARLTVELPSWKPREAPRPSGAP